MKRSSWFLLFGVMTLSAATGCGKKPGIDVMAATPEAREIYNQRCVTCHGANGMGDGPAGVALTPRPRNFTDQSWQSTVTDENINKVIVSGGVAIGKSPTMPPNPDLEAKPAVVNALVALIRSAKR